MNSHFMHQVAPACMHRWRVWTGLLCLLAVLAWGPRAYAHASLIDSAPEAGSVLVSPPAELRLTFNEPVSPLVLKLIQPDGSAVVLEQADTENNGLQISLPPLSQQGAYALSWRVVSSDGHPIGGSVAFAVGSSGQGMAANPIGEAHPLRSFLLWLGRLAWYLGLFAGVGLAGFHALSGDRRNGDRLCYGLLILAVAATALNVGLLGVDALDIPLSGLLHSGAWRTAATTSYGMSAALTLAALACAAWVWHARSVRAKRLAAMSSLLMLGGALAASGHASAAPPTWLARPAVWLHVVAATLWIGALFPLGRALGKTPDLTILRRFSRWIPSVLAALAAGGAVLIYLQFDSLPSLWRTDYGQVLMAKLALLVILLALGAYNRYWLTDAVLRSDTKARRNMHRVIHIECALAFAILAVVALWRFTPPPRALDMRPPGAAAFAAHIHGEQAMVDLILAPGTDRHTTQLTLYLSKPDLAYIDAQAVDVAFSNEVAGIEPIAFAATLSEDGSWRVDQVNLPQQPRWDVRIDILISDFERISLGTTLERSRQASH